MSPLSIVMNSCCQPNLSASLYLESLLIVGEADCSLDNELISNGDLLKEKKLEHYKVNRELSAFKSFKGELNMF